MSEVGDVGGGDEGVLVWQREIDEEALQNHWRRFGQWYAAPSAVGVVAAFVLGGFGPMLGVVILLGGIGALIAVWIFVHGLGMRANPEIRLINGQLVHAKRAVTVTEIEAWTTHLSSGGSVSNDVSSDGPAAMVIVRIPVMRDGVRGLRPDGGPAFELVKLPWAVMSAAELEGVREALTPYVPAVWVPIEQISS